MRIDLPLCNLKTCRYCFDGNCTDKIKHEQCEYTLAKTAFIPTAELDTTEDFAEWKPTTFSSLKCTKCEFEFNIMRCDFYLNMFFCPNCGRSIRKLQANGKQVKSEFVPCYRDGWRLKEGEEK